MCVGGCDAGVLALSVSVAAVEFTVVFFLFTLLFCLPISIFFFVFLQKMMADADHFEEIRQL